MLFHCLTKCIAWRDISFIWVNIECFEVSFLLQFCVIIEIHKMTDRNKIGRFVDVLLNSQVTACINSVCSCKHLSNYKLQKWFTNLILSDDLFENSFVIFLHSCNIKQKNYQWNLFGAFFSTFQNYILCRCHQLTWYTDCIR